MTGRLWLPDQEPTPDKERGKKYPGQKRAARACKKLRRKSTANKQDDGKLNQPMLLVRHGHGSTIIARPRVLPGESRPHAQGNCHKAERLSLLRVLFLSAPENAREPMLAGRDGPPGVGLIRAADESLSGSKFPSRPRKPLARWRRSTHRSRSDFPHDAM